LQNFTEAVGFGQLSPKLINLKIFFGDVLLLGYRLGHKLHESLIRLVLLESSGLTIVEARTGLALAH
jgi:hypothetical protein